MVKRGWRILLLILLLGFTGGAFIVTAQPCPKEGCPSPPPEHPPPGFISILAIVNLAGAPECDIQRKPIARAKVTLISKAAEVFKERVLAEGITNEEGKFATWIIIFSNNPQEAAQNLEVVIEKEGFELQSVVSVAVTIPVFGSFILASACMQAVEAPELSAFQKTLHDMLLRFFETNHASPEFLRSFTQTYNELMAYLNSIGPNRPRSLPTGVQLIELVKGRGSAKPIKGFALTVGPRTPKKGEDAGTCPPGEQLVIKEITFTNPTTQNQLIAFFSLPLPETMPPRAKQAFTAFNVTPGNSITIATDSFGSTIYDESSILEGIGGFFRNVGKTVVVAAAAPVIVVGSLAGCSPSQPATPSPIWIWTLERLPEDYQKNDCLKEALKLGESIAKSQKGQDALKKVNKPGVNLGEELKDGTGPEIELKELPGDPWARYEGDSGGKEDAVFLDNDSLDALLALCKDASKKKDVLILLAASILHETAHWKDDNKKHPDDDTDTPGEEGAQLEKDIFGGVLDMEPLTDGKPTGSSKLTKDNAEVDAGTKKNWADPEWWKTQ